MHTFAYAPSFQTPLDSILTIMHDDVKQVLRVFDVDLQEALDRKIRTLQPSSDMDNDLDTASDFGSTGEEDEDGIVLEDTHPEDWEVVGEEEDEEETNEEIQLMEARTKEELQASWKEIGKRKRMAKIEAQHYRILA